MQRKRNWLAIVGTCVLLAGCAGFNRSCASEMATTYGANWIVVKYDQNMQPRMCWKLQGVSLSNEDAGDGVSWLDDDTGHIIHIAGWYDRVQVSGTDYTRAAQQLGIDAARCTAGPYPTGA